MESFTGSVTVTIDLSNQTSVHPSSLNEVPINISYRFQRFTIDESDGTLTSAGTYTGVLLPVSSPNHLFTLIDSRLLGPPLSHDIADTIANGAIQSDMCILLRLEPYRTSVNVDLKEDVLFDNVSVSEESTCAICLEGLRNDDEDDNDLLPCPHRFHMRCIGEWLTRSNSCPLCREIVYEEDS